MILEPQLEQRHLPEAVAFERGELVVGGSQEALEVGWPKQPACARRRRREGVAAELERLPVQVGQEGKGKVALGAIDDRIWEQIPGAGLQDALAAAANSRETRSEY